PRGHRRRSDPGGECLVCAGSEDRRRAGTEAPMSRGASRTRLALAGALALMGALAAVPAAAALLAHREVLPNGIVPLVAGPPRVRIVAVRVLTRAGAAFDPDDQAGLANLTASVLTRGTAKRTGPEIDSAIEFVGGSLEAGAGRDSLTAALSVQKKDL